MLFEKILEFVVVYREVVLGGDIVVLNVEDDVDFYYVCFVKDNDNWFWELDGWCKGFIC